MPWRIYPSSRFAEVARSWDSVWSGAGSLPFFGSDFIKPLLAEFGGGRERIALFEEGGTYGAATLVEPVRMGMWQTFQPSQLPLGPWMASDPARQHALCESLIAALPGFAMGVGLTQQDPLFSPRPEDGPAVKTQDYISTAWVEVVGTFDQYWEARGKNLKQNLRKQRNKLQSEGVATTLELITDPAALEAAIVEYGALESSGWKGSNGTAVAADNAQGRFYLAMLKAYCAAGRGRVYRYRFNERVVAMDLCIDNGSTIVILKTAYDETYRTVSPAFLMRQDQFRELFEEARFKRIEFYGKVMEWHTRWTENARTIYHMTAYRWPLVRSAHEWLSNRQAAPVPAAETAPAGEGAGAPSAAAEGDKR